MSAWKGSLLLLLLAGSPAAEPTLGGRVTDAKGSGVASASVRVVALDARWRAAPAAGMTLPVDPPLAEALTDETGRFVLDAAAIPPGLHALAVRAPGLPVLLRWRERIAFGAGSLPVDLELRLPATTRVQGLVLDESGKILSGAQVTGVSESPSHAAVVTATTDEAGRFALSVPSESVLTLVGASPGRWGISRAPLSAAPAATLAIHAAPLDLVEGVATSATNGTPLPGVRVHASAPSWDPAAPTRTEATSAPWGRAPILEQLVTGEDGRFSVRVPRGGLGLISGSGSIAMRASSGTIPVPQAQPLRGKVVDERGMPVARADVRWSELPDAALTDDLGRFELPPNVNASVIASTADGAIASWDVGPTVPAEPGLRLVLPALAEIAGRVTRRAPEGEVPASGALVRVGTAAWDVVTATDADGRFALRLRGARSIVARQGDLEAESGFSGGAVMLALEERRSRAATPPPRHRLVVRVTDEAGRPLAGALARAMPADLSVLQDGPMPAAASDETGVAELLLPNAGSHVLGVSRPGRASATLHGVRAGKEQVVRLAAGAILRGIVRTPAGEPAGGAQVIVEQEVGQADAHSLALGVDPFRSLALAGGGGAFVLRDLPPGSHSVIAIAQGFLASTPQRVSLAAGTDTRLDIVVLPGATLSGQVRDEAGPIAGAQVEVAPRSRSLLGDGFEVARGRRAGYTDADGMFAIDGLDPETWHDVIVTAEWHATGTSGGRPSESLLDILMPATGAIDGRVEGEALDAHVVCEPASGEARDDGRESGEQFANVEDERFRIDDLAPGLYRCTVRSPLAEGIAERIDVRPRAATEIRVRMKEKPSIAVEVLAADTGRPIEGASVALGQSRGTTDADGRARVALPDAEELTEFLGGDDGLSEEDRSRMLAQRRAWLGSVRAEAESFESGSAELPEPPPKLVTIRLASLPLQRGLVVDASGPVAGVEVAWEDSSPGAITDAQGRFAIQVRHSGMREGSLVARRERGDVLEEGWASVSTDAPGDVTITLEPIAFARLTVRVLADSEPVAGARVVVGGDAADARGVTDAEGRFTANRLRPGAVGVLVETDGGQMKSRSGIELPPGGNITEEIVLGEGWMIEGRAVSASRGVEGVEITWVATGAGSFGASSITRTDGAFRLGPVDDAADEVMLIVLVPGRSRPRQVTVRRGQGPVTVDVSSVSLTGRVVAGGEPVAECMIEIACEGDDQEWNAVTRDDGTFVAGDVPGNGSCLLVLRRADGPAMSTPVRTRAEGTQDLGDIVLESRALRGQVIAHDGRMPSSLSISVLSSRGVQLSEDDVVVQGDGSFEIEIGEGAAAVLAISDREDLGMVAAPLADDAPLQLRFEPAAALEVRASGAQGTAQAWGWISELNGIALARGTVMGSAADDAPLVIDRLPGGRAVMMVMGTDGTASRVEATLAPGETTTVDAALR